tara:strand:+ start:252 stop:479 length:228 start_codon:yes stop_codon:yes gene_type:complete
METAVVASCACPNNVFHRYMQGIKLFLQGKVALAMPALLHQAKQPSINDYVVAGFIGAGFSMTAKRLTALVPRTL